MPEDLPPKGSVDTRRVVIVVAACLAGVGLLWWLIVATREDSGPVEYGYVFEVDGESSTACVTIYRQREGAYGEVGQRLFEREVELPWRDRRTIDLGDDQEVALYAAATECPRFYVVPPDLETSCRMRSEGLVLAAKDSEDDFEMLNRAVCEE